MERRLTAILSYDIVGYTRAMGADERGTLERLKADRRDVIGPKAAQHGGRIIKLMGDGALLEFASVVDAVGFAISTQYALVERQVELPDDGRLLYRIGINVGDVIVEGGDIYGDGVNVAVRLEGLAEPGGICIRRNVRNQVRGKLDLDFKDLGEVEVKNIERPVRAFHVVMNEKAAALAAAPVDRPPKPRNLARHWRSALAIALSVIVVAGILRWQPWTSESDTAGFENFASPERPSIAVMPFDNLSGDPEQDYFADGLTDDLITDLAKVSGLFVIARNSVFAYKDRTADTREVARELGVRYVLEGSVQRAGDRLRINAQLIDSETGGHLWADRLDRDASDIFAVQDEVIGYIVDALAVRLSRSEQQRLSRLPTESLEAYDLYLRAEQAARTGFRPKLREALRLYNNATALDPSFAQAFAADARTAAYVMRNNYDDVLPGPVARKRAYEHAGEALAINSEAPLPYSVLAVLQVVDGHHEAALVSAEQAVALGPSEAEAHAALSLVLTFSGRHAEAVVAIERAIKLNPNLPTGDRIVAGLAFLLDDNRERAIVTLERARDETPNVDDTHAMLSAAYAMAGQMEAARKAAAATVRLSPNVCVELYRVTLAHFRYASDLATILDAMRTAGLPQWPYAFTPGSLDALEAAEIHRVAFGRTWEGRLEGIGPALTQISSDGELAFRTTTYIATGQAYVSGDLLCERIEALSLGRPVCGPVYLRAGSPDEDRLAYTYVNASKVFHFSPVE